MIVLVLNCGSSSVKFQLIETDLERIRSSNEPILCSGSVEKIGMDAAIIRFKTQDGRVYKDTGAILEHRVAVRRILALLTDAEYGVVRSTDEIGAVGHRVVHGGEKFSGSVVITPEVLEMIRECIELAPLHNPHNLRGYEAASQLLPGIPHVAVFDTAFHQTMPPYAYLYGLPYVIYQRHAIRRYGFHGTSHRFVSYRIGQMLESHRDHMKLITIHLGNGCSMAALDHGKSIDTTMGFTPLEGLLMGTRTGDIDPAVILHIMSKEELTLQEANTLMNKHSGLYGVSGVSNDMREVLKEASHGNERAKIALDMFCYRIKKYIGAYMAAMDGCDSIIFTGGIGENSFVVREKTCANLRGLGIVLDTKANVEMSGKEGKISSPDSIVQVYVIPTNEELVIARDTVRCVCGVAY